MASTVAVLGGGISGLSTAYYLSRLAPPTTRIVLVEGSKRVGGWIQSNRVSSGTYDAHAHSDHKLLFEAGPRSLRPQGTGGAILLDLIRQLDLTNELLCVKKTDSSAKHRYIYYQDAINDLPSSLADVLFRRPPIFQSVIGAALREPFVRSRFAFQGDNHINNDDDDETLYEFTKRRFNEHVALNLVGAVTHGIYAGDAKQLSVKSTMRMLYENERVYGSVVKGLLRGGVKWDSFRELGMATRARKSDPAWFAELEDMSVIGFRQGTSTLTDALRDWLQTRENVELVMGEPVIQLHASADRATLDITTAHSQLKAEHVVSALPSHVLDQVLHNDALPHLSHNPVADVAVVNLGYQTSDIRLGYDGFGFLTPHRDSPSKVPIPGTLGVVFDSNAMPGQDPQEVTKVTVMLGGSDWNDAFDTPIGQLDPKTAYHRALQVMHAFLGVTSKPTHAQVHLQPRCIPQYTVGHEKRLQSLHHALERQYGHLLSVTGASYLGVSVPDCIKNSRALVEELVVSGAIGTRVKCITGIGKAAAGSSRNDTIDSTNVGKSHVDILMKS